MMRKIHWYGNGNITFSGIGGARVVLAPGTNKVPDTLWDQVAANNATVKRLQERGDLGVGARFDETHVPEKLKNLPRPVESVPVDTKAPAPEPPLQVVVPANAPVGEGAADGGDAPAQEGEGDAGAAKQEGPVNIGTLAAKEALEVVRAAETVDQVRAFAAQENGREKGSRSTIAKAIDARLKALAA